MAKIQVHWTVQTVETHYGIIDTADLPAPSYEAEDFLSRVLELLPSVESKQTVKTSWVEERDIDSLTVIEED